MRRHFAIVAMALTAIFLLACGGGSSKEQRQKAEQAIESAQKNRDLKQLMPVPYLQQKPTTGEAMPATG